MCVDKNETDRFQLVETIVDRIAKESPNGSIKREENKLTDIFKCDRKSNEPVDQFVNRLKGAGASYVNKTRMIEDNSSW